MSFEEDFAALNEWHFFREFTYSKTTFRRTPSQEVELADAIICVGDVLIVFQLKEREIRNDASPESEQKWFERKIMGQATRQIRDTLAYLKDVSPLEIRNHRGDTFALDFPAIQYFQKLVVYRPNDALPSGCKAQKHHISRTAGIIHIIPAVDYLGIVRTLLTPAEVADYLCFREVLIERWNIEIIGLPESALVGQYLHGNSAARPSIEFIENLKNLEHRAEEWDMSGIISKFRDRVTTENITTEYYPIVRELALLKRNELREFKLRFLLSREKTKADEFALPYRMTCLRTGCGFVFIPLTKEMVPHRQNALNNFTLGHKYQQKLRKCIGVSIADDSGGWHTVEWMYAEFPWEPDAVMEEFMQNSPPLRDVKEGELPRYRYRCTD